MRLEFLSSSAPARGNSPLRPVLGPVVDYRPGPESGQSQAAGGREGRPSKIFSQLGRGLSKLPGTLERGRGCCTGLGEANGATFKGAITGQHAATHNGAKVNQQGGRPTEKGPRRKGAVIHQAEKKGAKPAIFRLLRTKGCASMGLLESWADRFGGCTDASRRPGHASPVLLGTVRPGTQGALPGGGPRALFQDVFSPKQGRESVRICPV